jgi:hypothetical protein
MDQSEVPFAKVLASDLQIKSSVLENNSEASMFTYTE